MNEKEKYVLNKYNVTKDGKVFSTFTKKYLKFRIDQDGYYDVTLVYNDSGKRMPFRVSRLVALKHIPNPNNYDVVNHKDLDKQNNHVSNLEWCNISQNTQHGYDNCAYSHINKVKAIHPDGTTHVFPSTSHAARFYGYANPTTIQAVLEGRRHNPMTKGKCVGVKFEYTNESVTTIERIASTVASE